MTATTVRVAVIVVILIGAIVAIGRFEVYCLRDLAQTPDSELQYLTRPAWIAAIVLTIPLGGIAYLCCGKPP